MIEQINEAIDNLERSIKVNQMSLELITNNHMSNIDYLLENKVIDEEKHKELKKSNH